MINTSLFCEQVQNLARCAWERAVLAANGLDSHQKRLRIRGELETQAAWHERFSNLVEIENVMRWVK
jgi:hypothetical protein